MLKKITIAMGMVMVAGVAQAGDGGYMGASASSLKYSDSILSGDENLTMATVRLGGFFNQYFSGEVRWGLGFGDETVTLKNDPSSTVKAKVDYMSGAYLRGGFHATQSFYPYVIAGVTRADLTYVGGSSDHATDLSYGIGADFKVSDSISVNLEYMDYIEKSESLYPNQPMGNIKLSGVSIGFLGHF